MVTFFQKSHQNYELTLRSPQEKDLAALLDYINTLSQEKTFVSKQGEIMSLEKEKEYLDHILKKIKQKKNLHILAFADQTLIGNVAIELGKLTQRHIGSLGISVRKNYRGQGIGSLLMKTVLKQASTQLPGIEMVKLTVQKPNKIARKMYKKFGFKEYGLLPNGVKLEKGYRDHILMFKKIS